MVTHSYYDEDPRVRREAEGLVRAGHDVDVFALRRPEDQRAATIAGVQIRRSDVQRHQGAGIAIYLREYLSFLLRSAWSLTLAHRRRRYDLVQVHTLPDFLAFAALPLRIIGVPLILDLHEAMPEFFRSRFAAGSSPVAHRLLLLQERLSIRLASAVVTVNQAMADRLVALGVDRAKVHVVRNTPRLGLFDPALHPSRAFAADGVVRLVYAGALTPTYELDVALDALARLRRDQPSFAVALDLYGRGDAESRLREQVATLGLEDVVTFHGRIPLEAVPAAIAGADIGIAPTRRDRFTDVSLSTKIFEYAAMGKPVVATRLPLVETTFPAGTIRTYEAGDEASLATAISELTTDVGDREARVAATAALVSRSGWETESADYLALVERLTAR